MPDYQLIRCPNCRTTNRVPLEKIKQRLEAICGKCKTPLPVHTGPITVTDSTFAEEVERSQLPVLVDMWAEWCGPCRIIAPTVEQLAGELAGRMRVAKLNVDQNPATATRFGVRSIPTLLVFKRGKEVDRIVGVAPKQEIIRRLERTIAGTEKVAR